MLSTCGPDGAGFVIYLGFLYLSLIGNYYVKGLQMRYLVIAFILLLCWDPRVSAQPCLPDGIVINTQSQLDSFPINHPWCTMVLGTVNIYGDDITNLNGLNNT